MGIDAIIISRKKKLYHYIGRKYHVDPDHNCTYDEWEEGVSPKRAKELIAQAYERGFEELPKGTTNYKRLPHRGTLRVILKFINTLDENDTIEVIDDSDMYKGEYSDVYWYIQNEQHKIDNPKDEDNDVFYHPDYTEWREWREL